MAPWGLRWHLYSFTDLANAGGTSTLFNIMVPVVFDRCHVVHFILPYVGILKFKYIFTFIWYIAIGGGHSGIK